MKQSLWRKGSRFISCVQFQLKRCHHKAEAALLTVTILLLSGCAESVSTAGLKKKIALINGDQAFLPDTYTEYFSYYTGHGLGVYRKNETSAEFNLNGNIFIMNLNISGIMNGEEDIFTPSFLRSEKSIIDIDDAYVDSAGTVNKYKVLVTPLNQKNLLYFRTPTVIFMALCDNAAVNDLTGAMLTIARSVQVDKAAVRLACSEDEQLDYYGQKIKLFENVTPENGMISEIIEENNN